MIARYVVEPARVPIEIAAQPVEAGGDRVDVRVSEPRRHGPPTQLDDASARPDPGPRDVVRTDRDDPAVADGERAGQGSRAVHRGDAAPDEHEIGGHPRARPGRVTPALPGSIVGRRCSAGRSRSAARGAASRPRGRTRRARRRAAARGGRRGPPSAGRSRAARRARTASARRVSQHSMSTKPAASSRRTVAIGVSKWAGPSQPSPIVASDRAGPRRCCRRRRTGRRAGRPVGGRPRGSRTARRGRGPSGTSRSTGSRRPAPSSGSGSPEVRDDVLDPVAERRQPLARGIDHRRRAVERDDAPARQAIGEQLGDAARCRSRRRAPVRRRRAAADRGRPCPSASSGRRPGRRSGRPSRAVIASSSRGRCRRGSAARPAAGAPAPSRRPYHDTSAPDREQPGARQHRQVEGVDRRLVRRRRPAPAVAPAGGGLSGWNAVRTAGSPVSSPARRRRATRRTSR